MAADGAMVVVLVAIVGMVLLFAFVSILGFFWALMDILRAKNDTNWKLLWALVVLMLGLLGVMIYSSIGRKERVG